MRTIDDDEPKEHVGNEYGFAFSEMLFFLKTVILNKVREIVQICSVSRTSLQNFKICF